MKWDMLLAALATGGLLAEWWKGRRIRRSLEAQNLELRQDRHAAVRDAGLVQDRASRALRVLWHHIRPETPGEGVAVAELRAVFPTLPIPGAPIVLQRADAQRVLGRMVERAARARRLAGRTGGEAHAVMKARHLALREAMVALGLEVPDAGPAEVVPPEHVTVALDVLNQALDADPAAVSALFAHRVLCNEALAEHPTIQVRGGNQPTTVGPLGLLNGCLGVVPSGPKEGWGWVALEANDAGEVCRFVLTTEPPSGVAGAEAMVPPPEGCTHDVQPVPGDEDWGRCTKCGEGGFPLTVRAAYGDVECHTCKDTGLVPVDVEGKVVTDKRGREHVLAGAFADGPCPEPGCKAGKDGAE